MEEVKVGSAAWREQFPDEAEEWDKARVEDLLTHLREAKPQTFNK